MNILRRRIYNYIKVSSVSPELNIDIKKLNVDIIYINFFKKFKKFPWIYIIYTPRMNTHILYIDMPGIYA